MTQSQPQENIKITLIGGTGVGKTCIIKRLTDGSFDPDSNSTMGGSYSVKMLKIDQEEVKCDIWDTAGQEKYRSLGQLFYKDAYIVCLVYSINNKKTFEDMKEKWYPDLKQYGEKYQVLGVVANKSDMFEEEEVNLVPVLFSFINIFLWISIYYRISFRIYCSFNYEIRKELRKEKKREMTKLEEETVNDNDKNKGNKIEKVEVSVVFEKDRHPSYTKNIMTTKKYNDMKFNLKNIDKFKEEFPSGISSSNRDFDNNNNN